MNDSLCHDQIDINYFANLKIEEQPLIGAIFNPPKYNQIYSIFKIVVNIQVWKGETKGNNNIQYCKSSYENRYISYH